MTGILKGEWKTFLYKFMIAYVLSMTGCGIAGMILLKLILLLDPQSTYIYFATFITMYAAVLIAFVFLGKLINTRFTLLVSFGKKRSSVIWYNIAMCFIMAVLLYAGTMIIYFTERGLYPLIYPDRLLEAGFSFGFMVKYGLVIYIFVSLVICFFYVISLKFGGKVFVIFYLTAMILVLVLPRLKYVNITVVDSVLSAVLRLIVSIPAAGWTIIGIIVSAILTGVSYNILNKYDVKY